MEEAYENIGFGSISPVKIVNKLVETFVEKNIPKEEIINKNIKNNKNKNRNNDLVKVENIDNCGYITRGRGVTIHRKDCTNLKNLDSINRKINVEWKQQIKADFSCKINIFANNTDKIVSDVILKLKELKINLQEINSKINDSNEVIIQINVDISDSKQLQNLIKNLRKIDSVFDIRRLK